MTKRIFYVVLFSDIDVQRILNALRFISNPKEKGVAHITVRGPYQRHLEKTEIENAATTVENTPISVDGIGTFFGPDQNTVFLKCSSSALRKIWQKSDYVYNPHITLYDAENREVAEDLANQLNQIDLHFDCRAAGVFPLISYKDQLNFDLPGAFDAPYISKLVRCEVNGNMIKKMDWCDRLDLVVTLAKHLREICPATLQTSQVA